MNMTEKEIIFNELAALVREKERVDQEKGILKSVYKGELKQRIIDAEFGNFRAFDEKIWALRSGVRMRPVCKTCGGEFSKNGNRVKGFPVNCSTECVNRDPDVRAKLRTVFQAKYGVDHPSQIEEIKQKKKATVKSRYGTDHTLQSKIIKDKIKATNLKKYGVENCAQAELVKNQIRATNLEKYGAPCPLQNDVVNEKSKLALLQKFGVDNATKSAVVIDKIKATNLEKYGVENVQQAQIVKEKVYSTNLEKYGFKFAFQNEAVKQKISNANFKNYEDSLLPRRLEQIYAESKAIAQFSEWAGASTVYEWIHEPCGTVFKSDLFDGKIPVCPKCKPRSRPQQILRDFLETLDINFIENDRSILKPRELDFWIPEFKLGIEVNGVYWHRDGFGPGIVDKTHAMELAGNQLLHFWDIEINEKMPAVKNVILSKLKMQDRIAARKCVVREISSKESREFLSYWHLSGAANASLHLGIYHHDLLVGVGTFAKNRFSRDGSYELIRFACAGVTVIGGLSKIIKFAREKINFAKLVSFADRRISVGDSYNKIGWQLEHVTAPNYFYFKSGKKLSRQQAMKHKLQRLLGDLFNSELSELENMILAGWIKCADSGNLKFFKEF